MRRTKTLVLVLFTMFLVAGCAVKKDLVVTTNVSSVNSLVLIDGTVLNCWHVFEGYDGQIICLMEKPIAYTIDQVDLDRTFSSVVAKDIADRYAAYKERKELLEATLTPTVWQKPRYFFLSSYSHGGRSRGFYLDLAYELKKYLRLKSRTMRKDLYGW